MRAKLLFLAEQAAFREGLRPVQEVLSELAVAFSHSFVMREDTLKERLADLPGLALEHEVLLLAGNRASALEAAEALSCFAGMYRLNASGVGAELSRLKEGNIPSAELFWPLKEDPAAISKLAVMVCAYAKKEGCSILLCEGEQAGIFAEAFNRAAMYAALPAPELQTFEEVLDTLLFQQEMKHVVVTAAAQLPLFQSMLSFLSGTELLQHAVYSADKQRIYHVAPSPKGQSLPLFSLLYAATDAVRNSLNLVREADCLLTAVDNVLQSGWRTPEFGDLQKTIPQEEAIGLVVEQVHLAGELMERFQ